MNGSKLKIAHVITRLIVGGAQENTLATVRELQKNPAYTVVLITGPGLGPEGSMEDTAQKQKITMILFSQLRRAINPIRDTIVFFQLLFHFIRNRYDIVHTHSSKAGILARLAAFCARCPVIIHTIHGLPFHPYEKKWKNELYIFLEKNCAKVSDKIITVSDTMRDKALAAGVGRKDVYRTIYSGMAIDVFLDADQHRSKMRKKLNFSDTDIVVGKIGRLFHLKGHDFVIDAAKTIIAEIPQIKFLFVGGGILFDDLQHQITDMGIENHFVFTGLVPPTDIPALIASMDILVHTSLREGLARALPQAQACGKPVVTFDIDSAHEVVIHQQTGYLIQPGDRNGFIDAVCCLAKKPELRSAMGVRGRKNVYPRFCEKYMAQQIDNLYKELLCG